WRKELDSGIVASKLPPGTNLSDDSEAETIAINQANVEKLSLVDKEENDKDKKTRDRVPCWVD
ncbi:MAG: hypothetical protein IIA99_01935, partial [Proteobacteria bacterium]|nr:hypothetical protein [Pseudomonadota bacterium]